MKKKQTALEIIDVSNELKSAKIFDFENITKESIALAAEKISEPILDGQMSPSQKMIQFMALSAILEDVITNIKGAAMDELKLSKGSSKEIFGAIVSPMSTSKYDYSSCGHSEWERLNQEEASAKEGKKKIEAFLKTLQGSVYIQETGEEVHPPKSSGSETIKVAFKK